MLRLLTNPVITQAAVSAATALGVVTEITRHAGREYWPLDRDIVTGLRSLASGLRGYRQWTDAVLLRQAADREGVLVTFDAGLKQLAGRDSHRLVLVLKRN